MRRFLQTLAATTAVAFAFAATTGHASADSIDDYRSAMKSFSPVISSWLAEVEDAGIAAQAKPEVLQGAAMDEFAARGHAIAGDLAGTQAPGTYAEQHAALTAAVEALAAAADDAPNAEPAAFGERVADELSAARTALRDIFSYAVRRGKGIIDLPVPPVTGN